MTGAIHQDTDTNERPDLVTSPCIPQRRADAPSSPDEISPPRSFYARRGKRLLDVCIASAMLTLTAPVVTGAAAATARTLGRPILFRQPRVGRGGETFEMLKFRTMQPDRRAPRQPSGFGGPDRRRSHKSDHDPRHTPVGRILRRYSIDELPQLINVLRGEMSLVGPRPELGSVADALGIRNHARHLVRPGLTGLWQVSADRPGFVHENLHYDLEYLRTMSFRTDVSIMVRTIPAVLWATGR